VADYAGSVAAAAGWLRGEDGGTAVSGLRTRMAALGADRRFEEAAQLRDQLEALERVRSALGRLRAAAARSGVLLAADMDDRFVQAFACAGGRVVARRRLPRAGDAALECAPLVAPLRSALESRPVPLRPDQADVAHVIAAAFARPGRSVVAVPLSADAVASAATHIAVRRERVPLRR
jgi:excinuclease UvrABC nuclease subunit